MRWIAPSLVALALVFSTGGVAIVGRADSAAPATPAVQSRSAAKEKAVQCAVPNSKPRNSAATRSKRSAVLDSGKNSIVLNTTGYNYATDGQWKGSPVDPPKGLPVGLLPKAPKTAPAAPASK